MMPQRSAGIALLAAIALLASACAGEAAPSDSSTLTVLAASSLTGSLTQLADQFEAEHPGVSVRLAFGSSATLAEQAAQGAPADVLATADQTTMQAAVDAGVLARTPITFASNTMTLVVPQGNASSVESFADLDDPGIDYVTCVETAPCGATAQKLLQSNSITDAPASREIDVKAVLAKVIEDEADAGIVYRTDAVAAGDSVTPIDIPGADDDVQLYPVGVLDQSADPELAQQFVALLTSPQGQSTLRSAGFGPP